jgi:DNA-binding CsgD family transcriptional regulator
LNEPQPVPVDDLLDALSVDVRRALEAVSVPAYIVDSQRRLRWQNAASIELIGDLRGRLDAGLVAPADLARAREAFRQKQEGASHTKVEVSIERPNGRRARIAVNSVPLKNSDGAMIGSFGLIQVLGEIDPASASAPRLSPRERETLTLLAAGCSTEQMAQQMGIAKETVRNHVRGVLSSLDARSRLEAVAKARRVGLL